MKSLYGLFGLALLIYAEYGINYYDEHYNDNIRREFFCNTEVIADITAAAMRMIIIGSANCERKRSISGVFLPSASLFCRFRQNAGVPARK